MNFKRLLQYTFFGSFTIFALWGHHWVGEQISPKENTSFDIVKDEVYAKADNFAGKVGFSGYSRSAILDSDSDYSNYQKYKLDGVNTWNAVRSKYGYDVYKWSIRYFKSYEPSELKVYISPEGRFLGFNKHVSDDWLSKNIEKSQALSKIKAFAKSHNIPLTKYKEIEYKFHKQKNGRIDHQFVFEHKDKVEDGYVRYSMSVCGDSLTGFSQFFKVPDTFLKEYSDMRAKNGIFSNIGLAISMIYILIMLFMLVKYFREGKLNIKSAVIIAALMFMSIVINQVNDIPTILHNAYNTTTHVWIFGSSWFLSSVAYYTIIFLLFVVITVAAITLDKEAFPKHHSIQSIFNKRFLASNTYLQLVLVGFMVGAVDLLGASAFYYLAEHAFGWTSAGYGIHGADFSGFIPGVFGLTEAPRAGLMEELFFRVLPLSIAVLYARKSKKSWVIPLAFVVQWIAFAGVHIGYPSIPFYFRIVEFIIPITLFAILYYQWGLIPAAISHYFYDFIILMGGTVWHYSKFFGRAAGVIVVLLGLFPIWLHLYYRYIAKVTPEAEYNEDIKYEKPILTNLKWTRLVSDKSSYFVVMLLAIALFKTLPLAKVPDIIPREKAISIAKDYLISQKLEIGEITANIVERNRPARSILWKQDAEKFNSFDDQGLMGYVWNISSKNRDKLIKYDMRISKEGTIVAVNSFYKDSIEMKSLSKEEAIKKANAFVRSHYKFSEEKMKSLTLNNVEEQKRDKRTDWVVVYKVDSLLKISIEVIGDKVQGFAKYIDIPEKDLRENSFSGSLVKLFDSYSYTMEKIMLSIILIAALLGSRFGMNKSFPTLVVTSILFGILSVWNNWNSLLAGIPLTSNLQEQMFASIIMPIILLVINAILAFGALFSVKSLGWKRTGSDWVEKMKPILYFSLIYIFVVGLSQMFYFDDSIVMYVNAKSTNLTIFIAMFSALTISIVSWLTVMFAVKVVNNKLFSIAAFLALALGTANQLPGEYWHVLIYGAILWVSIFFIYEIYWKKDVTSLPLAICVALSATNLNLIKNIGYAIGLSSVILLMVLFTHAIGEDA